MPALRPGGTAIPGCGPAFQIRNIAESERIRYYIEWDLIRARPRGAQYTVFPFSARAQAALSFLSQFGVRYSYSSVLFRRVVQTISSMTILGAAHAGFACADLESTSRRANFTFRSSSCGGMR